MMSLKERVYSVLIVSASEKPDASLLTLFPLPLFTPVTVVPGLISARRAISERSFDLVVVNSPLPDGSGITFALDTAQRSRAVVLFLARSGQYDDEYDTLVSNGVFVLKKPVPKTVFEMAIGFMISSRELMRKSEDQALSLEEKIKEMRLVNRAKWMLISKENMTEPEAHRCIEKQAMDQCVPKRLIAERIIEKYT